MKPQRLLWPMCLIALASVLRGNCVSAQERADGDAELAVERAIDFLAREVDRWPREEGCFSCHNNGDAARALMIAHGAELAGARGGLKTTLQWLARPRRWNQENADAPYKDPELASLQFAAAQAEARRQGLLADEGPAEEAARQLAATQDGDGSWAAGEAGAIGSPATWGRTLATAMAIRTLRRLAPEARDVIDAAEHWIGAARIQNVVEASAVLLALEGRTGSKAARRREQCRELLLGSQAERGGWGPFWISSPEPFDTALAMLALASLPPERRPAQALARGRDYLIEMQDPDGGWPETTRPAGYESYAQRMSTSGWATMAVIVTGGRSGEGLSP